MIQDQALGGVVGTAVSGKKTMGTKALLRVSECQAVVG
jgi:hypothetical protein